MLTIRDTQMTALQSEKLAAFFERARVFIASRLSRPVALAEIQILYERGKEYELVSEQELARYMFVGVATGTAALAADPDWMRRVLEVPTPTAELKLSRLFDVAQQHVSPDIAGTADR